jgi:hypothetical protein
MFIVIKGLGTDKQRGDRSVDLQTKTGAGSQVLSPGAQELKQSVLQQHLEGAAVSGVDSELLEKRLPHPVP